jgi:hypothetical protein
MYLYEKNTNSLVVQRNRREIELIVKECILNAMRDSIPIEKLIRSYMDPTIEEDVEVTEETNIVGEEPILESTNSSSGIDVNLENEPMPELAPSKTTSAVNTHGEASSSESEKVSVLEAIEREQMKTAEAKELEAMREILADVQSSDAPTSTLSPEVKFNDDVKVTSIDSPYPEEERESRMGYAGDGDDDDSGQNGIQIGESVNLDIGAETIIDGDSVSILVCKDGYDQSLSTRFLTHLLSTVKVGSFSFTGIIFKTHFEFSPYNGSVHPVSFFLCFRVF